MYVLTQQTYFDFSLLKSVQVCIFVLFEAQTYYENVDILFFLKEKNINKFKCVNLKKKIKFKN